MVGHQMRQIVSNNGVLDLDQFYLDATAMGATQDKALFEAELNALPAIAKREAETVLVPGIYKNGKVYGFNGATKGLVEFDFSRESSATYFDKNGIMQTAAPGMPRIDHDPVTKECRGYLIESASVNWIPYSENFNTWTGGYVTTPTIDKRDSKGKLFWEITRLREASETIELGAEIGVSLPNTKYTSRVTVRAGSSDRVIVRIGMVADPESGYPDSSGTAFTTSGKIISGPGLLSAAIPGLYQVDGLSATQDTVIETTRKYTAAGIPIALAIYPNAREGSSTNKSIFLSTTQLEAGPATSYIPTNGSAQLRAADNIASSRNILPYAQASFYLNSAPLKTVDLPFAYIYFDNNLLEFIGYSSDGTIRAKVYDSPYIYPLDTGGFPANANGEGKRFVTSFGDNGIKMAVNGGNAAQGNYTHPLGQSPNSPLVLTPINTLKSLAVFSRQLTDQEHIEITS